MVAFRCAAEPSRAQLQGAGAQPPPQPRLHHSRGPPRRGFASGGRYGPPGHHHAQPGQRPGQRGDPGSAGRSGQQPRQQAGLQQDQRRSGQAQPDGDRQVPACRPCLPQQAASTLAHKAMLAARFGGVITRHV